MIPLLVLLLIAHWLADYTHLSTRWMRHAKGRGSPQLPILAHAAVHAGLMFLVLLGFVPVGQALKLAACQLVTHYLIDLWKGSMNRWFPLLVSPENPWHWYLFGFDQLLHQLVIVFISSLAFG